MNNWLRFFAVNLWHHSSREIRANVTHCCCTEANITNLTLEKISVQREIRIHNKCIDCLFEAAPQSDYILQKEGKQQFFDCWWVPFCRIRDPILSRFKINRTSHCISASEHPQCTNTPGRFSYTFYACLLSSSSIQTVRVGSCFIRVSPEHRKRKETHLFHVL